MQSDVYPLTSRFRVSPNGQGYEGKINEEIRKSVKKYTVVKHQAA